MYQMKNYLKIALWVGLIALGCIATIKFSKKINWAKKYLVEKESYRHHKITNPLIDKIPENKNKIIFGLDLSHHQRNINWDKVANNPPHFIIFKTTEGSSHTDSKHKQYRKKAREKNILVGGYHFFSYQSTGKKQARHFLKHLKLEKGDIIPVLDVEFSKTMNSDTWIKENIEAFITTMEEEIGVKPIIYCEIAYYNRFLKSKYGDEIHLWLSDFRTKPENQFVLWQKTDKYKQSGISGTVDYNIFNGSKADLYKICY